MTKRRASGEGSIYQLPDGRWAAAIDLGRRPDGRRDRRKREARTKEDAVIALKRMLREIEDHGTLPLAGRTVQDTVDDYMEQICAPRPRSRSTQSRDLSFAAAVRDALGTKHTAKLTVQDCDRFLADFANGTAAANGGPVGRDYVKRARSFLRNALDNDMRLGFTNRNVAQLAVMPVITKAPKNKRALSVREWRSLHDRAKGAIRLAVDISGRHGLRPQETRSVKWSDIDFDNNTLSVVTQFDSEDEFVDPKTVDSTRTIPLHPDLVDDMKRWRNAQQRLRNNAGDRWEDRDLVVASQTGRAIRQDRYLDLLAQLCQQAEIPRITPYELRHTAITHQTERVRSAGPVARWAGTSEAMIRRHYWHRLRDVIEIDPPNYNEGDENGNPGT